jgi:hypothetical protein
VRNQHHAFRGLESQPRGQPLPEHLHTETPVVIMEGAVEAGRLQMQLQSQVGVQDDAKRNDAVIRRRL